MSTVRFFCDEHVAGFLADAVTRQEPAIEMSYVGQAAMPPKGTVDPDLLIFAEEQRCLFLTSDRKTMPLHISDHQAIGRHTWGVFILRRGLPITPFVDSLTLIWSESQAEDWIDHAG